MTILRFYHRYIVNSSLMQHRYGDFKAELMLSLAFHFAHEKSMRNPLP